MTVMGSTPTSVTYHVCDLKQGINSSKLQLSNLYVRLIMLSRVLVRIDTQ